MMGCCLELGLLAFGLYLACAGEIKTVGGKSISGAAVRVAGIIFCLPLPLSFLVGFIVGFSQGLKGQTRLSKEWMATLGLTEIAILGGSVVLGGLTLAWASLNPSKPRNRRDEWGHDMDYPYLSEQRRRVDFDEVFDTHGPALPPRTPAKPPPEHAQAVVSERPVPPPAARHWAGDDEFLEAEFPRPRSERRQANSEKKQTLVMVAISMVIFVIVAGIGAVLMWPK